MLEGGTVVQVLEGGTVVQVLHGMYLMLQFVYVFAVFPRLLDQVYSALICLSIQH